MDDLKNKLLELVVKDLPGEFIRKILQVFPLVYQEAYARSFEDPAWDGPEAHDICGHLRRALFESRLRKIALESGLIAKSFRNPKLTSYYTLVRAGQLVLTQSSLQSEWRMVRPAVYRTQHSAINHILINPTFPEFGMNPPQLFDGGEVYSILFHGPQYKNPSEFGFAEIGFPEVGSDKTLYTFPLSLIARAQAGPIAPEDIEDRVKPKFRRKKEPGTE